MPIELEVYPNYGPDILEANIRANAKRNLPFLLHQKFEKKSEPLAIVGGGPSLKHTLPQLEKFRDVMVCGSAHDHVIAHGIKPKYAVWCDAMPDPQFFRNSQIDCTYLLATQCDSSAFDALDGHKILMWDCIFGAINSEVFGSRLPHCIVGGSTAAMRAPALGLVLGYSDFHFFGVDSSFEDEDDRHAYEYEDESHLMPARLAEINGRIFKTTNQFVAQAQDFQHILTNFGTKFSVNVYGDSLLAAVWQDMRAKTDALFKRERD
jgi:hypothetical protein